MNKLPRFTLKKLKFNEAMSEETACFSADLYENGKLIAHISNRGQGGSNDIRPADGLTYKDVAHLDNIDTECEILILVEETNIVNKHQSNSFVVKKDGKIYTLKYKSSFAQIRKANPTKFYDWLNNEIRRTKAEGYEILNTNIGL